MPPLKPTGRVVALFYLILCAVYLIYLPHAEYFVDDWILMPRFRAAAADGLGGAFGFGVTAAQNRIYNVYRMQWLSILYGFLVTELGGYRAQVNFVLLLLLHAANGWLLCQGLRRLGVEPRLSFLAGALFLLAPAHRFVLFTYFTNPFFVFSTFWVLLMLYVWAGGSRWRWPLAAACAVAGLFAGEQVFALLWSAIPLAALCLTKRLPGRGILAVWAALGAAGYAYIAFISGVSPRQVGLTKRYEWTWHTFKNNASLIIEEMGRLSGIPSDSFFRISPGALDAALALAAGGLVAAVVWLRGQRAGGFVPPGRILLYGLLATVAGYGPTLWLAGGYPLRYHYVPAPFLATAIAALCWTLARGRRRMRAVLAGLMCGAFAVNAASEMRQCWIVQAQHARSLKAEVRSLRNIEPGDILIVVGAPEEIGTATHFILHSPETATPFAEWITGVSPLAVAAGLVHSPGHLALYQKWGQHKHLSGSDFQRLHVLVWTAEGGFFHPEWVAYEYERGRFRLFALKGSSIPAGLAASSFTRDQLALAPRKIYFP